MRHGFDLSKPGGHGLIVACSQCQALVINYVACHETGCPNATKECKGCSEIIPARGPRYCTECL